MKIQVKKQDVINQFGGIQSVADLIGTSYQNVHQWGEVLTQKQVGLVIASIVINNKSVFLENEVIAGLLPSVLFGGQSEVKDEV